MGNVNAVIVKLALAELIWKRKCFLVTFSFKIYSSRDNMELMKCAPRAPYKILSFLPRVYYHIVHLLLFSHFLPHTPPSEHPHVYFSFFLKFNDKNLSITRILPPKKSITVISEKPHFNHKGQKLWFRHSITQGFNSNHKHSFKNSHTVYFQEKRMKNGKEK